MNKMLIACLLMVGVLAFSATGLAAEPQTGVQPLKCSLTESVSSEVNPSPRGTTNCGTYTCSNDGSCCEGRCCPSGYNIYCRKSNKCYNSTAAAQADCGNSYYICPVPAK